MENIKLSLKANEPGSAALKDGGDDALNDKNAFYEQVPSKKQVQDLHASLDLFNKEIKTLKDQTSLTL